MPRMGGFDVIAWVRQQPGLKRLPLVVLTLPGTSRPPGRRIGSPDWVSSTGAVSATRSAASQPASTSESVQGVCPSPPEVSQFERSEPKIGVSSAPLCATRVVALLSR